MEINKNLSKNLLLRYSDVITCNPDGTARIIRFWFTFFGEDAYFDFSKKNIDADISSATFGEAPTEIYESFEERVTETHWEAIKEAFRKTEKLHNKEYQAPPPKNPNPAS